MSTEEKVISAENPKVFMDLRKIKDKAKRMLIINERKNYLFACENFTKVSVSIWVT